MINYSMIIELTVDKKNREKYNLSFVAYVCIAAFQHVIQPPQDDGWKVSERDQTWVTDNDLHDYLIFAYRVKNVFGFHSRELFALSKADFFLKGTVML
jgi:hypothetical protein